MLDKRTAADLKEGFVFLNHFLNHYSTASGQGESGLLCNIERISGVLRRLPADLAAFSSHLTQPETESF